MLRRLLLALGLWAAPLSGAAADAPEVVVSIPPVHSLVAGVMAGVGEPELLVRGAASAHSYVLRPSDARRLARADIVFWIGPDLESFLRKPLATLGRGARIVTLAEEAGIDLLRNREAGVHGHAAEDREAAHDAGDHPAGRYDMHLWLDPGNAGRIVQTAVAALGAQDPANAARYTANGQRVIRRLEALDADLRAMLAPVRDVPFVTFHDAYRYFEDRYGLNAVGSVTLSPERAPGARRLYEVRSRIRETGARCVFSEPQYDAGLVATAIEGTPARSAQLDPLGAGIEPGPDAYFILLRRLAAALAGCLAASS